jgi:DNA-binding MarR family transcriptional regulator
LPAAGPIQDLSYKRAVESLIWALRPLSDLGGSISLSFATAFLFVAFEEGQSISSYARSMGVGRFTMWRYLHDMSERARGGGSGLGLVCIKPHPTVKRRFQVYLTAKGRSLVRKIFEQMKRSEQLSVGS